MLFGFGKLPAIAILALAEVLNHVLHRADRSQATVGDIGWVRIFALEKNIHPVKKSSPENQTETGKFTGLFLAPAPCDLGSTKIESVTGFNAIREGVSVNLDDE